MEHRSRSEARERCAEMLELIGIRPNPNPRDHRHLPIAVSPLSDDPAQGAPVARIRWCMRDDEVLRPKPTLVKVIAIARRAAGQSSRERRRPALEVATRSENRVRVD